MSTVRITETGNIQEIDYPTGYYPLYVTVPVHQIPELMKLLNEIHDEYMKEQRITADKKRLRIWNNQNTNSNGA